MTNTKKLIGAKKAATLTENEIQRAVFRGAGSNELRGLSDAFSFEGIQAIASNPNAGSWRWVACGYLAG